MPIVRITRMSFIRNETSTKTDATMPISSMVLITPNAFSGSAPDSVSRVASSHPDTVSSTFFIYSALYQNFVQNAIALW